jgi:hypothetical protein
MLASGLIAGCATTRAAEPATAADTARVATFIERGPTDPPCEPAVKRLNGWAYEVRCGEDLHYVRCGHNADSTCCTLDTREHAIKPITVVAPTIEVCR